MSCANEYIYVIGDSHAMFFLGKDTIEWPKHFSHLTSRGINECFNVFSIGPLLAYKLKEKPTYRHIMDNKIIPIGSRLIYAFGEIDCRAHLIKQSERQGLPVEDVIKDCVLTYFEAILEARELGYRPIVWNAIASTLGQYQKAGLSIEEDPNYGYPSYGPCLRRNEVTKIFNKEVEEKCLEYNIPFVSIFKHLIGNDGLTKKECLCDSLHLSKKLFPVAMKEMKRMGLIIKEDSCASVIQRKLRDLSPAFKKVSA